MKTNITFDPLVYLNIKTDKRDRALFAQGVIERLSNYLIIRLVELLPEEELENIDSPSRLFDMIKAKIPNVEEKVKFFLDEFKRDTKNQNG